MMIYIIVKTNLSFGLDPDLVKDGLLSFSDPQRLEIFRNGFRVVGCKWTREVCKGGAKMGFFRWARIVGMWGMGSRWIPSKIFFSLNILLLEEILHHLGCIKPCKYWEKTTYQLVQDFFINSIPLQNIRDAKSGFFTTWSHSIDELT